MANLLTLLVLIATGGVIAFYLVIGFNPTTFLNPYPPPLTLSPQQPFFLTPTPTLEQSQPVQLVLPNPTPLRPVTPTGLPERSAPFSDTVELGPRPPFLDCTNSLLIGTVSDLAGEPLIGYPIHVWGPGVNVITLSGSAPAYGPSGWEVAVTEVDERESLEFFVQLHDYSHYRVHPPLSRIVCVALLQVCPQALIVFQERP